MGAILCIGDIMLDVVTRINQDINVGSDTKAQISTHGGGAAANVATWLGHLGADVTWLHELVRMQLGQQF